MHLWKQATIRGVDIVLREFSDDSGISTTSVLRGGIALKRTQEALKWCRMRLNPQSLGVL